MGWQAGVSCGWRLRSVQRVVLRKCHSAEKQDCHGTGQHKQRRGGRPADDHADLRRQLHWVLLPMCIRVSVLIAIQAAKFMAI
jgi:hypothetical protein